LQDFIIDFEELLVYQLMMNMVKFIFEQHLLV